MHRPDCASAQSDPYFCYSLSESMISKFATNNVSRFQIVSVAEKAGSDMK